MKFAYTIGVCFLLIATTAGAQNASSVTTAQFFVDGVCEMCKKRIEQALLKVEGVESADWEIATRQLQVEYDSTMINVYQLHWEVAAVGHDTEQLKAPGKAYNSLHDCCKYRDAAVRNKHKPQPPAAPAAASPKAPQVIAGLVMQQASRGDTLTPLTGVNIYWLGATQGAVTDAQGRFSLERPKGQRQLVAQYVGFAPDTILLDDNNFVEIILSESHTLETVDVTYRKRPTEYRLFDPVKVQVMNEDELLKAACCNLSESFTTNPSVDVGFTDAVTGTRQIRMLGLAGPNVQITRENMPEIRGLSAIHGLSHVPGPWMKGLQLIKGGGSVVNGYEAIAGQINLELHQPESGDRLYLNLYGNEGSRMEGNAVVNHSLSDRWHYGFSLHGKTLQAELDRNGDGFLDNPTGEELYLLHRWKYRGGNGWNAQFGMRGMYIDQNSGQLGLSNTDAGNASHLWTANLTTRRFGGWAKIGKVFPNRPYASLGLQVSAFQHDQDARFGERPYDAGQQSAYANLIYQSRIVDTRHTFKTGLSFQYDRLDEQLNEQSFERKEAIPGAFFEYTYEPGEKMTAVAGIRGDYHNNYGFFVTPRLHLRYAFTDLTVARLSAGKGRRTASILAEQTGALASARRFVIASQEANAPYGLNQEIAWNFGANFTQGFQLLGRAAVWSFDAYHTRFQQQVVVDYDQNPQAVHFYQLDGDSYSNSLHTQLDMELLPRLDVRLAYRFNDVRVDYAEARRERPFVSRHRAFVNTAYETADKWAFDLTVNWQGAQRLPITSGNPEPLQLDARSPDFFQLNTQVSKQWNEQFELYIGLENLLDFRQDRPILSSAEPFGEFFDASMVWGPVFGRMTYLGVRYWIGEE